jgi:hypothetical protein
LFAVHGGARLGACNDGLFSLRPDPRIDQLARSRAGGRRGARGEELDE